MRPTGNWCYVERFEQYEIWVLNGERWELSAWFPDFDMAAALARNRSRRVRVIRAVYEEGKRTQEEVLAEVGSTRDKP